MLVDLLDQRAGGTGTGQRHGAPGQLLDAGETALALAPDQPQRHLVQDRSTAVHATDQARVEQFARGGKVALTALQGPE
ncbi:hypothetical protein D3C73_1448020 [compost metagenome]